MPAMHESERLIQNCRMVMEGAKLLGVPLLVSEQYPKGLGPTVDAIGEAVGEGTILPKRTFSCVRDEAMRNWLDLPATRQVVLMGIEAHVCVMQTALDLRDLGVDVFVVADAVTSRSKSSVKIAMNRLSNASVSLVSAEMVLFEWMKTSESPQFRAVSGLVR